MGRGNGGAGSRGAVRPHPKRRLLLRAEQLPGGIAEALEMLYSARGKICCPPAPVQEQTNFAQQKKHEKLIVSHKIEMEPGTQPREPRELIMRGA